MDPQSLPIGDDAGDEKATTKISKGWLILLGKICALVRRNILEEKRRHKLALKLAERLIGKDSSWDETINMQVAPGFQFDEDQSIKVAIPVAGDYKPIPLLLATENGIVEIVTRILEVCPQLVEHKNDLGQNILHVAIKHRRYDIFNHVKNMKIPMTWIVRKVDKYGYTILHHAADMEPETTKIHRAGPVYQLQQEIKWYKRVEKITPSQFAMLRDKMHNKTCEELFNMKHNELLGKAQQWTKDTSESCSAVAVLVATVVFAAAYTVPGGSNEKGYPIFLNSTLFLVFTIMDVIALACSLTSVVMFLSVLTSPYTYDEFLLELPRKLTIGFSLLFISLATTMIAFAATLLLIIRSEKPHWTTTLIYTAAFFPVSIFALMNFPMYAAFEKTLLKFYRRLYKNRCVTKKPPPPQKPASRQGSIAYQAAPKKTESHTEQNRKDGQLSKRNVNDNEPKLPV
ncbi:ankyrin repeat-containing protein NPR4-like [Mangifera indica]|uniref:ankyrin repeat-containing protein NPR4-like n=1 Tax=Mangifera indica TaxID=29780 RepID=UPI001CFA8522|nr:ankyrin repeat-containing protein NPR4-like [Mangifera indica]